MSYFKVLIPKTVLIEHAPNLKSFGTIYFLVKTAPKVSDL